MSAKYPLTFCSLIVLVAVLALPSSVSADVYVKMASHTDAVEMMNQKFPAVNDTNVTWFGKNKSRMNHGDSASSIMLMEKNTIYMINHNDKTYSEMPLDKIGDMSAWLEAAAGDDEETAAMKQMMQQMMSMMQISAKVTPTGETQKIKGFNCTKYQLIMNIGPVSNTQDIWATEDIKVDYDAYRKANNALLLQFPGMDKAIEELKKIKGFTVKSTSTRNMMGTMLTSTTELVESKEESAPAGTYDIPKDYKKVEWGADIMDRMKQRK